MKKYGGNAGLIRLKQAYYNESLADLVLNRNELRKVYEKGDHLIRKMEPVYSMPSSKVGRAHFFAAYKQVGNLIISTLWFNIIAIWLMTLFLYISLQFRWLAALINFFGRGNRNG